MGKKFQPIDVIYVCPKSGGGEGRSEGKHPCKGVLFFL
jgi:hypothetical protein